MPCGALWCARPCKPHSCSPSPPRRPRRRPMPFRCGADEDPWGDPQESPTKALGKVPGAALDLDALMADMEEQDEPMVGEVQGAEQKSYKLRLARAFLKIQSAGKMLQAKDEKMVATLSREEMGIKKLRSRISVCAASLRPCPTWPIHSGSTQR